MQKIMEVTQKQFDILENAENKEKVLKDIINLQSASCYKIGDTTIKVQEAKPLDVFKNTFKDRTTYYFIIRPLDSETAFAYSLYPM